jgi:hypothetical protein
MNRFSVQNVQSLNIMQVIHMLSYQCALKRNIIFTLHSQKSLNKSNQSIANVLIFRQWHSMSLLSAYDSETAALIKHYCK